MSDSAIQRSRATVPGQRPLIESLEGRTLLSSPVRVMPLGASVTAGLDGHASYRYWLWQSLQSDGFKNVDLVGSQRTAPLYKDFDQDNEGHSGWRADEIAANAKAWATAAKPDFVLLHAGTNDFFQGQSVASTVSDLGAVIDNLRAAVPNVTILLAQILPDTQNPNEINQLDAQIPTLAAQKTTANSKVIVVDMHSGVNASTDLYDGTHPNEATEKLVAARWNAALEPLLPIAPAVPTRAYLSNMDVSSATNGWGPYERDRSNGEADASDGSPLTLNGNYYPKGLGVHANSDLHFYLGRGYKTFVADVGVDDEEGANGTVDFQVFDNLGNKLYDSGRMTATSPTKSISIDVSNVLELRLLVTDAGDGNSFDHADWGNAYVTAAASGAPIVADFSGATISEGGTYSASGSFFDSGTGPWTATVNYGDGSGAQSLPLNGKSFALSHIYADNGNYTTLVSVTSTAGTGTGSNNALVNVANIAPSITMPPSGNATAGSTYSAGGSFVDPGVNDTFTATVNYGDGSATQALALAANKTFALSRNYAAAGFYTVSVTITDKDGGPTTATTTVNVTSAGGTSTTYLSDLSPTFSSNGWGTYEKDRSNGEANTGDGTTIKINGTSFARGLGVHAPSELRYALGKAYSRFKASVGLDDETGGNGSVQFLVYGDGALLFDSGVLRGRQNAKAVDVDVSGVNELKLVVGNAGDGANYDHADWANAAVYKSASFTVNAIVAQTINEGATYTATGSFADPGSGPWTATVNYGDGSATQTLALAADKTFGLSHLYADNGAYNVTVSVNNGASTTSAIGAVTVKNVAPTITNAKTLATNVGYLLFTGNFVDPGADSWTGTADFGDGTGVQSIAVDRAARTFTLDHAYTYNGIYSVVVTITDDDGGAGTTTFSLTLTGAKPLPTKYLSDLTPSSATNGWGAYERDMSNGEQASFDGRTISIGGVQYAKGLGVHASSDLTYSLTGGTYTHFLANIGVDDEQGGNGSVDFKIYLDGIIAYDSGTTRAGAAKGIDLSVLGKTTIRLVVTDAGDGNTSDHADWAAARLT